MIFCENLTLNMYCISEYFVKKTSRFLLLRFWLVFYMFLSSLRYSRFDNYLIDRFNNLWALLYALNIIFKFIFTIWIFNFIELI